MFGTCMHLRRWLLGATSSAMFTRFVMSGIIGTMVYFCIELPSEYVLRLPFLVAATIAFLPLLKVNFELQRRFVFIHATEEKKLQYFKWFVPKQIAVFIAAQGPVEPLADYVGYPKPAVNVATIVTVAVVSYVLSWLIFEFHLYTLKALAKKVCRWFRQT